MPWCVCARARSLSPSLSLSLSLPLPLPLPPSLPPSLPLPLCEQALSGILHSEAMDYIHYGDGDFECGRSSGRRRKRFAVWNFRSIYDIR